MKKETLIVTITILVTLIIAGIIAEGTTELYNLSHIDRGYEKIEEAVRLLGGDMRRV